MNPRGLTVTLTICFSLLAHAQQLSLVKLFDKTAGIGKKWKLIMMYVQTEGQTDMKSKIVISMHSLYADKVISPSISDPKVLSLFVYLDTTLEVK